MDKKSAIIVWIYALILLAGGAAGFLIAGSPASLIASGTFALLFFIIGYFIQQGYRFAGLAAALGASFLLFFFAYRFYLSEWKPFPGGAMTVLTTLFLIYLIANKARLQGVCHMMGRCNGCHTAENHSRDSYNNRQDTK